MSQASTGIKPYCYPVCAACRVADCPKGVPPKQPRSYEWPDRLTGKLLACGHRAPMIPTVLGLVDPSHVWCDRCGDWQPIPERGKREVPETTEPGNDLLSTEERNEIPF